MGFSLPETCLTSKGKGKTAYSNLVNLHSILPKLSLGTLRASSKYKSPPKILISRVLKEALGFSCFRNHYKTTLILEDHQKKDDQKTIMAQEVVEKLSQVESPPLKCGETVMLHGSTCRYIRCIGNPTLGVLVLIRRNIKHP